MLESTRIKTEIPGPKSRALMERRRGAISSGIGIATPSFAQEAKGALLTDVDGNTFIDFGGGIGVMNVGHADPRVVAAVKAQVEKFTHTCFYVTEYEPYKKTFGPFAPEVYRVPAPYPYRCPAGKDCSGGCQGDCFDFVERAFVGSVDPSSVAAILVEPVSGEGGFLPFPDFYLRRLRKVCDEYGILLIADEIQTGFGRTGKMFCVEHAGVVPDLVTTAKSLGGGLPIGGVTGRAEVMDSVHVGGLGTTYGGNPLACAAALAVLETFEEKDLISRANV